MITVVSLGTERGDLSLRAKAALCRADETLVRTAAVPSVRTLDDEGIPYETLDFLYETSRNYDTLAKKIAGEVKRRGKDRSVCYCVDGSGAEDAAALLLLAGGAALIDGRSKASYFAGNLGGIYGALRLFRWRGRALSPARRL